MPTIKLSSVAVSAVVGTSSGGILRNNTYLSYPAFGVVGVAKLRIMKGTIPSQSALDTLHPTESRIVGSPNDVLIEWVVIGGGQTPIESNSKIYWPHQVIPAIQSGVATWWIWSGNTLYDPVIPGPAPGNPDGKYLPAIVGTISARTGSPLGDLTLDDVNIVAGQKYDVGPFEISLPNEYTWNTVAGNDTFTRLLIHSDTFEGDTSAVDSSVGGTHSPHTVSMLNGAHHSTAKAKFGATSIRTWSGSPQIDEVASADDTDWTLGTSDFAIDCWVNFTSFQNGNFMASQFDGGSSNQKAWGFAYINTDNKLQLTYSTDGSTNTIATSGAGTFTPSLNTWYHVAVTRNGADLRFFVDGTQIGSTFNISTDSIFDSTTSLRLGCIYVSGVIYPPNSMDGYIDEFRFSVGTPRWTSNFTPPAYPYGP